MYDWVRDVGEPTAINQNYNQSNGPWFTCPMTLLNHNNTFGSSKCLINIYMLVYSEYRASYASYLTYESILLLKIMNKMSSITWSETTGELQEIHKLK